MGDQNKKPSVARENEDAEEGTDISRSAPGLKPLTNVPESVVKQDHPESGQILERIEDLIAEPEIGPETEEEVGARRDLNRVVHRMLILGLLLSTAVLFSGLALSAISHRPLPTRVSEFRQLFRGLRTADPPSILSLGILLLIATPVLRVIGSLFEFLQKRDWRYAIITSVVLLILIVSVIAGSG